MGKYIQETGWHIVAIMPEEYRWDRRKGRKAVEAWQNSWAIKDGRDFYDFRIDPVTWRIWLKKKTKPFNFVTTR